jgi:hypothetical protein
VRRKRCALLKHEYNRCASPKGLQNHVHTCSDGVTPYPLTFALKKKKLGKKITRQSALWIGSGAKKKQQPCCANSSHSAHRCDGRMAAVIIIEMFLQNLMLTGILIATTHDTGREEVRITAHAVSRRPLTAAALVGFVVNTKLYCDRSLFTRTSGFPRHHFSNAPYSFFHLTLALHNRSTGQCS